MRVQTLQRLDRWFGLPACLALSVVRAIVERGPIPNTRPGRLLLIKLAEQGSTVLAWAALRRAVELVGREHVYAAVFEENRFILDALDIIPAANVVTIRTGSLLVLVADVLRAIRRLRALRCDAAIDFEFFSCGSAALAFLSGARRRVGYHASFGGGPARGNLMTHRLVYNPHVHTTDAFWSLVEALRLEPHTLPTLPFPAVGGDRHDLPRFQPDVQERAHVAALLKEAAGDPDGPIVLLNANASDALPLRRWPAGRYVALARRLLAAHGDLRIVFTGSPAEAATIGRLVDEVASSRCVSVAGRTTLRELLTLYHVSSVLVTNDSGPAHFAALTPVRVIALFGPETPRLFGARTLRHTALWAGLACSPCVSAYNNRQSACRNNVCMQRIPVDDVFEAVEQVIGATEIRHAISVS